MKVISVIGQKGGSGKSTVAVHLAVCAEQAGLSAAIIDTDPQGSAHKWFERRSASTPGVVREIDADVLPNLITRARANDVDVLLVDTPGKAETMALAACELADMVLVPIRPTQFDLETLGTVKRTIRIAERTNYAWVMLNQCPTSSKRAVEQGEEVVRQYGLNLAPQRFYTRADFSHALAGGLTAPEFNEGGKAADEARDLFQWINSALPLARKQQRAVV
jgi:chromosome partitioning protein